MFNLGPGEITVMALLAISLFGPKRLPAVPGVARRWSLSDWLRLVAALATVRVACALLSAAPR